MKIGRGILVITFTVIGFAANAQTSKECKMTEQEIRQLWLTLKVAQTNGDEARATAMTRDSVERAERSCEERKTWKPTPLPPELQKLSR
jgi:hypothetical protein